MDGLKRSEGVVVIGTTNRIEAIDPALPAIAQLGGQLLAIEPVELPEVEPRTLVIIEKIAPTPPQYPRAPGIPAKRPL